MRRVLLIAVVFGLLIVRGSPASARKWTSGGGQFTIEAELVDVTSGKVRLKKPEGKIITVPIERLDAADQHFLASLKKSAPSYVGDVQPFLTKYCVECHKSSKVRGGYKVETLADLTRVGKKGPMVVPGRPAESQLILSIQSQDKPMPPKKSVQPTAEEIGKVSSWIAAGAPDDSAPQVRQAGVTPISYSRPGNRPDLEEKTPTKTQPPQKTDAGAVKETAESAVKTPSPKKAAGAEPPAVPKVSSFAPVDDLVYQTDKYLSELKKATADPETYKDQIENTISGNASTLALLALALGLHDQDNKYKANASALMEAAQKVAAAKDYEPTKKAVEALAAAAQGKGIGTAELQWAKVAGIAPLMKKVPAINTAIRRDLKKLATNDKDAAANSATLAVIAQGSMAVAPDAQKPDDCKKWHEFCVQMRDAAAAVNAHVHARNATAAKEIVDGRLQQSCADCHESFH